MNLWRVGSLGVSLLLLLLSAAAQAQLLANNQTLNAQSVQRWMQSNRAMAPAMQALDAMHTSAEALQQFEQLSAAEQDAQIQVYLQGRQKWQAAQSVAQRLGWKSVGEYQRLSTRLGNAIAAYFLLADMQGLDEAQREALRAKTDPAILAVPAADVAFVKANEQALQAYIQAYAAGR